MDKWISKYLKKQTSLGNKPRVVLGILSGKIGFFSNFLLFVIKIFAGLVAGSVSIIADAVNNLSDSISSVVTVFGFHVAAKPPDKEHPYGHERSEYITGLIISIVILFVGYEFLGVSIQRIIEPTAIQSSFLVTSLLVLSIIIKLIQRFFYQRVYQKIHSTAIRAASQDSLNDIYITLVVLFSSIIESITGWRIDGFSGLIIAFYILYSGIELIRESIDDLIGTRPSKEKIEQLIEQLDEYPSIVGYHDLLMHNYGPNKTFATIHIEVDDRWSLNHAHQLVNDIQKKSKKKLGIELLCHLDPIAIQSKEETLVYQQIKSILKSLDLGLTFHDFRIVSSHDKETIQFDVVVPEGISLTNEELYDKIEKLVQKRIGVYPLEIVFDRIYLLKND